MERIKGLLRYFALFFIPIIILIVILINLNVSPFGEGSIWYIDLPAQLTMFYNHLYDVFRGSSSAIYTWNYGMGTSFWATICYYLSSPLSFLILLFPRSFIPFSILIIWLIKIGLSSISMSYLLKVHFTQNQYKIFIFSISYALMSFSITYYFLPMWLDAIYLLPIIIAGVHNIIRNENYYLFLISLTILFIANFYISYMVGIFVFLYFIVECFINQFRKKEVLKRFVLFFKSVILAFLFTSFITVPTYLQIRNNEYTSEGVDLLSYLLNPLDLYGNFFNGTTQIQNLSIYSGLVVLLLMPLYFLNKYYSVRERVSYGILLAFILYSMTNSLLNMAWHVFEVPNGAHYRYAFLVSFLMVILSVKAINKWEATSNRKLICVTAVNFLFLCFANKMLDPKIFSLGLINKNILILTFFALIILILMNNKLSKRVHAFSRILLCLVVFVDMGMNCQYILQNYVNVSLPYNWYNVNKPSFEKAIDKLHSYDESFYRTKVDPSLVTSPNESLRYKYKGMSIYTSTGNAENSMFLSRLGYSANIRAVSMENGIFLSDVLLGFKYLITTQDLDANVYTKIFEEDNIKVYRIKINLPLGYMVNKNFMNINSEKNVFSTQNSLIYGASSKEQPLYYELQNPLEKLNSLVYQSDNEGNQILQRQLSNSIPTYEATFEFNDSRELYMELDSETYLNYEDKLEILINNAPVKGFKLGNINLIDLGIYDDERVTITIKLKNDIQSLQKPIFYTLNYSNLEKDINQLKTNTLKINDYSDTNVSGKITVQNDKEMLFLSIPYDNNWKISVDGKHIDYHKIGDFIGVKLTNGTHIIHLEYVPRVLYISMGVSAFSALAYIIFIVLKNRKKLRKSK